MFDPVPSVSIPAFPYFCNVVVFPAPSNESTFFIIKKSADVPDTILGKLTVEYVPGSVYCLLPSNEKSHGSVSVYNSRPSFLSEYNYCLEINVKSLDCNLASNLNPFKKYEAVRSDKCTGCFVSHFPSPNTSLCKLKKAKRTYRESSSKYWPVRLRGGANSEQTVIIERAVLNAEAHGIKIHAGPQNLANGNCVFESIIDSINTRASFLEKIEGTPDHWRNI